MHLRLDVLVQSVAHRRREHASPSREVSAHHTVDEGAHIDPASPERAAASRDPLPKAPTILLAGLAAQGPRDP
jgi:hypothetical protein